MPWRLTLHPSIRCTVLETSVKCHSNTSTKHTNTKCGKYQFQSTVSPKFVLKYWFKNSQNRGFAENMPPAAHNYPLWGRSVVALKTCQLPGGKCHQHNSDHLNVSGLCRHTDIILSEQHRLSLDVGSLIALRTNGSSWGGRPPNARWKTGGKWQTILVR